MLRVHIVQLCYTLSDPAMEYSCVRGGRLCCTKRSRCGALPGCGCRNRSPMRAPSSTFATCWSSTNWGQGPFEEIKEHLAGQGVRLREGTIVDATIIEAPSSTKNRTGQRDPEMRQVKKGNQSHFGMKLHIGVDAKMGLVHSLSAAPPNVHDVTEAHRLLHGGEQLVWRDAGYIGVQNREENLGLAVDWQVVMKPGQRRKLEPGSAAALKEKVKASIRAESLPRCRTGYATVAWPRTGSG